MPDRIRLDGKVAVVTGAAGVIGTRDHAAVGRARRAHCRRRPQAAGPADRDQGSCRPRRRRWRSPPTSPARTRSQNMSAPPSTSSAPSTCFTTMPASRATSRRSPKYSLETFRRVLDVNVVGVFLGMKHVLPVMLKQNKGSIINTASIAGLIGSPDIAVYSASKHAVIGLTKSAALECAGDRRARELRLPRPDRQPDAERDHRGPQSRQRAGSQRQDRGADSGAPARTGFRSRLHRGVPRLRRSQLCLGLRLHRRRRRPRA